MDLTRCCVVYANTYDEALNKIGGSDKLDSVDYIITKTQTDLKIFTTDGIEVLANMPEFHEYQRTVYPDGTAHIWHVCGIDEIAALNTARRNPEILPGDFVKVHTEQGPGFLYVYSSGEFYPMLNDDGSKMR